jgi:GAF domain-containing protein
MVNYQELNQSLRALIQGVPHRTANLANASALLYMTLDRINWAGFYLLEGDRLILGPFQGKPACIEIPIGKGVCGTAAERRETILVPDVHAFPGHIACDSASNSEIVLPLFQRKRAEDGTEALSVVGVLDIDSPLKNRFTEEDRVGLTEFAEILSDALFS